MPVFRDRERRLCRLVAVASVGCGNFRHDPPEALRESQGDRERFHRTAVMHLQQQYLAVQAKLDRAYEDRIAGRITDELWLRKSGDWEAELSSVRRETARHEHASHDYAATGSKILELAVRLACRRH